ncbi:MAG TPA: PspC domain-containing protein, partial [Solirubrobacteraceae bacterium]|nr:PspC domain-containing protein [Solirubrobacteraceae bacterium]
MPDIATSPSSPPRTASPWRDLRRDPENGVIAGVCEGVGRRLDIDPLLLRIVFGATTLASGFGLVAYVLAWWLLPVEGAEPRAAGAAAERRTAPNRRAALEVGSGVGCLVVAILLTFRELGLPFSDVLTWPLVLVAAGGALIWRQSVGRPGSRAG